MLELIELYWIQPVLWLMLIFAGLWILGQVLQLTKDREAAFANLRRDDPDQLDAGAQKAFTMTRILLADGQPYSTCRVVVSVGGKQKEVTVTVKDLDTQAVVAANGLPPRRPSLTAVS